MKSDSVLVFVFAICVSRLKFGDLKVASNGMHRLAYIHTLFVSARMLPISNPPLQNLRACRNCVLCSILYVVTTGFVPCFAKQLYIIPIPICP